MEKLADTLQVKLGGLIFIMNNSILCLDHAFFQDNETEHGSLHLRTEVLANHLNIELVACMYLLFRGTTRFLHMNMHMHCFDWRQ